MKPSANLPGSPGALAALWWGWIGAPAWWFAQFEARYALVPWACRHDRRWLVLGFGAGAFVGSLALVAWAWRARRKSTGEEPQTFLAIGAVGTAVLFASLVLAQMVPDFFLGPCRQ